ncbi:unnamed protein product, partial [Effrenium voratum]
ALQAVNSHEFGGLRHNPRCERSHGLHEALEFRPSQAEANASMPSVAEIVGGHGEPLGPGFTGISNQNLAREAVASRRAILLYACRLILVWCLHFFDLCTDIWVTVLLHLEGRETLFALSIIFLLLPTSLRWAVTTFIMNPCTPDFTGQREYQREQHPLLYPKLAYVPILGELVVVANSIHKQWGSERPNLQDKNDVGGALIYLRFLEGAFEATPQAVIQGIVLYEDLAAEKEILAIQWQSFVLSFLAIGLSLGSVALHLRTQRAHYDHSAVLHFLGSGALALYMATDSFLRMNSIATVMFSPYAAWFPIYTCTAYAGLPLVVVTITLICTTFCEKRDGQGHVSCCGHGAVLGIMCTGTALTSACSFLIPLDMVMCWSFPPLSLLRLLEHLAMSIFSFLVAAPLTWAPLLLWVLCALAVLPSRLLLELPCGPLERVSLRSCRRWRCCRRVKVQPLPPSSQGTKGQEESQWQKKVQELASRGFTVGRLLDFCEALGTEEVMPHFCGRRSTTNDVVRQAIIPWSRLQGSWPSICRGSGGVGSGRALASAMEAEAQQAEVMITHNWDNLFGDLVAAVVAGVLYNVTYDVVLDTLRSSRGIQELRAQCEKSDRLDVVIWICAFSINQHASICGGFGVAPPVNEDAWRLYDLKRRDSVTKKIYCTCNCGAQKYFNDSRDECELNKFDAMLGYLGKHQRGFWQIVAVDQALQIFSRAWCVAELVEARRLALKQRLVVHSKDSVSGKKTSPLKNIRVQDCKASRPEDVDEILAKIEDKDRFNEELKRALFTDNDSLFQQFFRSTGELAHADLQSAFLDAIA